MSGEDPVRAQYEAYPYPARDPADEARRLVVGSPSNLDELEHYLFRGARDFSKPFRALFAGGGSGDGAIMLAQQLAERGQPAELLHLDLSEKTQAVARARAQARGLTNIAFRQGSLLQLSQLALGRFDYIDCCGVLHHLEDPRAGLRALAGALAEGGGLGLMLYAPYGRRGVYETQALLRQLGGDKPLAERLDLTRRLLAQLPATHWLKRNPFLADLKGGDAALVDLLLHPIDRAFTVPQVLELLDDAGLRAAAFIEPLRYQPASYLSDARLRQAADALPEAERWAAAERLAGNMKTHIFYALPKAAPPSVASLDLPDEAVRRVVPRPWQLDSPALAKSLGNERRLNVERGGLSLSLPLPRHAQAMLALLDGTRDLEAIHAALAANDKRLTWPDFASEFAELFHALGGINRLFLRLPAS